MCKPTIACPCVDCSSLVRVSTPCCLIFIKSISAASVAVVLQRSCPLAKSILIDHNWLSQTHIDPIQTHAQGPLKTHSLHNSLSNEVLPPIWHFIKEIIFDFFNHCAITVLTETNKSWSLLSSPHVMRHVILWYYFHQRSQNKGLFFLLYLIRQIFTVYVSKLYFILYYIL